MGFFCTFILCFLAVTLKYKSKKKWHQIIFHAGGYVIRLNKCVHRGASTREINTARARACSLSKQSGERRANNQSAQGIALGERMYQGYAPQGQNHLASPHLVCVQLFFCPFRAFLLLHLCPQDSFAPSGRFYCCTFVRRALPWADVSLPLRGVGSGCLSLAPLPWGKATGRRALLGNGFGGGWQHPPFGRAGVGSFCSGG